MFDLLQKVNNQNTDKILLDKLKKFIEKHGIIDKDNNQIKWTMDNQKMICYHYYDLTKQLTSNDNSTTFFNKFHSKYCNVQFANSDNSLYCKYCHEAISTQKESSFEGFMREGGVIQLREQIEEDQIIQNIEDDPKWKALRLNNNQIQILRYITNFLQRINMTMKFEDLKSILFTTVKQLFTLDSLI